MLRADSFPIGTRFAYVPNPSRLGTLVGYSKQGPDMAIIEWDGGLQLQAIPVSELTPCGPDKVENLSQLELYKRVQPKDKLYEVILSVPYYAYADSVSDALTYAEDALDHCTGSFAKSVAKIIKVSKDAKYRKYFTDDDNVYNSHDYDIGVGEAFADLKNLGKGKSGAKGSAKDKSGTKGVKSKRDQLYHAAEEHGGKASVLLSSEPNKNTKTKNKSKKKR